MRRALLQSSMARNALRALQGNSTREAMNVDSASSAWACMNGPVLSCEWDHPADTRWARHVIDPCRLNRQCSIPLSWFSAILSSGRNFMTDRSSEVETVGEALIQIYTSLTEVGIRLWEVVSRLLLNKSTSLQLVGTDSKELTCLRHRDC